MEEIKKVHHLLKLKEIERRGRVKSRQESAAEHIYGCLILADYFLPKAQKKMDRLKVYRLLIHHDLVNIEAGDTFVLDKKKVKTQFKRESDAASMLKAKLPVSMSNDFQKLWNEFTEQKTNEAKFCNAIDKLEPVLHSLFDKEAWIINKFTEQNLRANKEEHFTEFPEMLEFFNKLVKYMADNGYFTS